MAPPYLKKNNAKTTLLANITNVAISLTIPLSDIGKFPTTGTFPATIWPLNGTPGQGEIILVTAVASNVWTITRAAEPIAGASVAQAWGAGSNIEMLITAGVLAQYDALGVGSIVEGEVPGGAVDGSNVTYTTLGTFIAGHLRVYRDGLRLKGGGVDFTEAAGLNGFTMVTAPVTSSTLLVDYDGQTTGYTTGTVSFVYNEVPTGLINGSNAVYTTLRPYVAGTTQVMVNGLILKPVTDYAETTPASGVITLTTAPLASDTVMVSYNLAVSAAGNASTLSGYATSTTGQVGYIPVVDANSSLGFDKVRLDQQTDQAIANNITVYIAYGASSETFKTNAALHNTVTNNSRVTIQKTGYYNITGGVRIAGGNTTGHMELTLVINRTTTAASTWQPMSTLSLYLNASGPAFLNAGDYVELQCYQNSGGSLTAQAVPGDTFLSVTTLP